MRTTDDRDSRLETSPRPPVRRSSGSASDRVLALQAEAGNRAVTGLLRPRVAVQRSLADSVDDYTTFAMSKAKDPTLSVRGYVEKLLGWTKSKLEADGNHPWTRQSLDGKGPGSFNGLDWLMSLKVADAQAQVAWLRRDGYPRLKGYVDTVLHESYHCEQYFVMAKVLAKRMGDSANSLDLRNKLPVPPSVADRAVRLRNTVTPEQERLVGPWEPWLTDRGIKAWLVVVRKIRDGCDAFIRAAYLKTEDPTRVRQKLLAVFDEQWPALGEKAAEVNPGNTEQLAAIKKHNEAFTQLRDEVQRELSGLTATDTNGFAAAGAAGSAVDQLFTATFDAYQHTDQVEQSAWDLGGLAGTSFESKFPSL